MDIPLRPPASTTPTQPHAIFQIPDLLEHIFNLILPRASRLHLEELEKEEREWREESCNTLAKTMRVNKLLSEVAGRILWRDLEALEPLWRLVEPIVEEREGETQHTLPPPEWPDFARARDSSGPTTSADFARYLHYARYVQQLRVDERSVTIPDVFFSCLGHEEHSALVTIPSCFMITQKHPESQYFFPNLRRLLYPITGLVSSTGQITTAHQFRHFINPNLVDITLVWNSSYNFGSDRPKTFLAILPILAVSLPNSLRSLSFMRVPLFLEDISAFRDLLAPNLPNLQELALCVGSDAVLTVLHSLPESLRECRMTIQTPTLSTSASTYTHLTTNLRSLEAFAYDMEDIFRCLEIWPRAPLLDQIGCGVYYTPTAEKMHDILLALLNYSGTEISSFTLCDHYMPLTPQVISSRYLPDYLLLPHHLEPLLQLKNLVNLNINTFSEVIVSKELMVEFGKAWPKLRFVFLAPFTVTKQKERRTPNLATLKDLIEFAAGCRELQTLGIRVDARRPRPPSPILSSTTMRSSSSSSAAKQISEEIAQLPSVPWVRTLRIASSDLDDEVYVTEVLRRCFPGLKMLLWADPDEVEGLRLSQESSAKWQLVEDALGLGGVVRV